MIRILSTTLPFRSRRASAGFTLIEILIVLAIIGTVMAIAAPRLMRKENNMKSVARHFFVLGKEVRNRARLTGVTFRLVIDMNPTEPAYWVERGSGPILIDPKADGNRDDDEDDEKKKASPWSMDNVLTKEKKLLPKGLLFGSVETINAPAPVTEGVAYIHFFPEGLMEASALQITDGKNLTWTLIFNPLTGQADIVEQAKGLKDVSR